MKVLIDDDVRGALRPLTEEEFCGLRVKLQVEGCWQPLLYFRVGDKCYVLDGHHRMQICIEEGIKFNWYDMSHVVRTKEEAVAWVKENQASRRNYSLEEIRAMRLQRIENVVAARERGESIRTIAEAEGVSKTQVERDLEEAGVPGGTPEPPEGKVTGQDGKNYPATKPPILCKRCRRAGPSKDCPACLEARVAATKTTRAAPANPARAKATKNGAESFSMKRVREGAGVLIAQLDRLAVDLGLAQAGKPIRMTPHHAKLRGKIDELVTDISNWRKGK